MDPERYRKAGEIYHAVLALPPNRRAEYLEQACAADVDLLTDVESLLSAHADAGQFIETPHLHMGSLLQSVLTLPAEDGERSSVSDTSFAPGQQLGRYQIVALLGAGGMGTVYRAVDPTLGREVAIKALTPTFRGDSASLRRFEREARVLATLNHPNIATIYGFERLDGSPYLILERVDGETLADRLSRGSMAIDEAVSLAGQIVAGLEEAHDKGVIAT